MVVALLPTEGVHGVSSGPERESVTARLSLSQLVMRYLETHGHGSFESTSLKTAGVQLGHFERTLGEAFPPSSPSRSPTCSGTSSPARSRSTGAGGSARRP